MRIEHFIRLYIPIPHTLGRTVQGKLPALFSADLLRDIVHDR